MTLTIVENSKYLDQKLLTEIAEEVFSFLGRSFDVGVNFVSSDEIRKLNKNYRKKDAPTNVLSFNSSSDTSDGDIVICEVVVEEEAEELGYDPKELGILYTVHGLLHLAGYDHQKPADRAKMEKAEAEIMSKFGIYINR